MTDLKATILAVALLAGAFAGCLGPAEDIEEPSGDSYVGPDRYNPTFANTKPAVATALKAVGRLMIDNDTSWPAGGGNWAQGDFVYGSALGNSFFIADVSDPAAPKMVYTPTDPENTTAYARKAEVVTHPDGRLTLALATQSLGMHLWDVTDPYNPVWADYVEFGEMPNHYVAVLPGLEVVMNNPSRGDGATNHFVDVSDPFNPVVLGEFGVAGCHGTTFLNHYGHEKFRAYCAGIDRTEIWDMTGWDPNATDLGIKVLGVVRTQDLNDPIAGNPALGQYPVRTLHHLATANEEGTVLIIGDEHNGGGTPGACYAYDETTGLSTPLGALWFYDISDETNPTLLSWLSPPTVTPNIPDGPPNWPPNDPTDPNAWLRPVLGNVPNCTAHFGEIVEGEQKIVIGWYSAGVLLIDFTDPAKPVILDQYQPDPVNTWSARYHNGYVFTGDLARGMEVLQLV